MACWTAWRNASISARISLGDEFDPSIGEVAHVAGHLESPGHGWAVKRNPTPCTRPE